MAVSVKNLEYLVQAAIVNETFGHLLLNNPKKALQNTPFKEKFNLSSAEKRVILSIKARSIQDLAHRVNQIKERYL